MSNRTALPATRTYKSSSFQRRFWWAHKGSNLGPLPCEGNALPLSYASGIFVHNQRPANWRLIEQNTPPETAIYEVRGTGVKLIASIEAGPSMPPLQREPS